MENDERQPTVSGGGIIRIRRNSDSSCGKITNDPDPTKNITLRTNDNTPHTDEEIIVTSQRPRPTTQVSFKLRLSHRQAASEDDGEGDQQGQGNDSQNENSKIQNALKDSSSPVAETKPARKPRRHRTDSYKRNLFAHNVLGVPINSEATNISSKSPNSRPPIPDDGYPASLQRRRSSFRGKERKGASGVGGIFRQWRIYAGEQKRDATEYVGVTLRSNRNAAEKGTDGGQITSCRSLNASFQEGLHPLRPGQQNINDNGSHAGSMSSGMYQYYIPPPEEADDHTLFHALGKLYSGAFSDLTMWLYGTSLIQVFAFFLVLYFTFVYFFVIVLYLVDWFGSGGKCVAEGMEEGDMNTRAMMEFAFELSWTTFTTVGYGTVAPPGDDVGCYPVRLICSIEAILGVGFVSCCSGIFYAKLMRMLAVAPVTFSSTLCVQYGKGLEDSGKRYGPVSKHSFGETHWGEDDLDDEFDLCESDTTMDGTSGEGPKLRIRRPRLEQQQFHPFPVIEFRILNNRANCAPGRNEIWDAQVTAIVQLSEQDGPIDDVDADSQDGEKESDDEASIKSSRWHSNSTPSNTNEKCSNKRNGKVYYTLKFKPSFHPYFNRIWFLRHTLDTSSPLLRREIRKAIRDRGKQFGWDPTLNNYNHIRACLVEFNSLRIIMNGASALSKSEVYAEKVYTFDDVCIGWQFVGICYDVDEDDEANNAASRLCGSKWRPFRHCTRGTPNPPTFEDRTRVDLSLIHDIVPQRGGDFEPVETEDDLLQG